MKLVEGLSDDAYQHLLLKLDDGTAIDLTLRYQPQQQAWVADLVYTSASGANTTINGRRLVTHPNWMRQWQNLLPFGLAIVTDDNMDPVNQEDFADGTSLIYVLDSSEVAQVEQLVFARS